MQKTKFIASLLVLGVMTAPLFGLSGSVSADSAFGTTGPTGQERVLEMIQAEMPDGLAFDPKGWNMSGPRLHRALGYATTAGVVATGLLGWLKPGDLHGAVAAVTTGMAAVNTGIGVYSYARYGSVPLPHVILTGIGTLGFAANLFLVEAEDDEGEDSSNTDLHRAIGIGSSAAFALGVSWVIAF